VDPPDEVKGQNEQLTNTRPANTNHAQNSTHGPSEKRNLKAKEKIEKA